MIDLAIRRFALLLALPLALLLTGAARGGDPVPDTRTESLSPEAALLAQAAPRVVLERNGAVFARFRTVSGLDSQNEVVEFREGGDDTGTVRKLPGPLSFGNVTLVRHLIADDLSLWEWRREVQTDFGRARSDVTIRLLGRGGNEVAVWQLTNAWPAKVTGPQPRSDGSGVAIETLEIAHEGLMRTK